MQIKGSIEGHPLTFYYNLSNPEASLSCDDTLHFNAASELFELGEGTGARTQLNIQMPSIKNLAQNLGSSCPPEVCKELLNQASSPQEYRELLKAKIAEGLQKSFSYDKRIASRISRHTEKNLTIQEFQDSFIPPKVKTALTSGKLLNQDPQIKKLFHLLDHSSEKSTSGELQVLRSSIKKLNTFLSSPQKIEKCPNPTIKKLMTPLKNLQLGEEGIEGRYQGISGFLNLFTKQNLLSPSLDTQNPDYQLAINDFSAFVQLLDTPDPQFIQEKYFSSFSTVFQEKYKLLAKKEEEQNRQKLDEAYAEKINAAFVEE